MPAAIGFVLLISLALAAILWLVALAFGVTLNFILLYVAVVIIVFILIKILG